MPKKLLVHLNLVLLALFIALPGFAENSGECFYVDKLGKTRIVNSINRVPDEYQASAKCLSSNNQNFMAAPHEIKHKGLVRKENMTSPLGRIELSWPREVEAYFGRSPKREVLDVARAVSKTLKSTSFPTKIRLLDTDWKIVFLGKDLAASQIPAYLRSACHPGWMTPPTNIYIAAEKIATQCGRKKLSPSQASDYMVETLAHEMGHVIEAAILGNNFNSDRPRAEGFATWFEVHVAKYSSLLSESALENKVFKLARGFTGGGFDGSAGAYGIASIPFFALVDRRGVSGLMNVYQHMLSSGQSFDQSYGQVTGWSDVKIQKELKRVLK